ncbi:hypothetical protein WA026_008827 [Henosepilachna vigintioctopunctata]|uniref:Uncharacterized protein n=1 Tax=Henosepilachna vigintioctopunctata TaxID=420089 RepID=A0AAW1V5U6_9CUCU
MIMECASVGACVSESNSDEIDSYFIVESGHDWASEEEGSDSERAEEQEIEFNEATMVLAVKFSDVLAQKTDSCICSVMYLSNLTQGQKDKRKIKPHRYFICSQQLS